MHYRLSCLLLVILGLCVTAAPAATPQPPDQVDARFVQKRTLPHFDEPLVSRGEIHFSADRGLVWQVKKPYQYTFALHDDEAREILPDGTHKTLDPDDNPWLTAVRQIFVGMLAGDRTALQRYFSISTAQDDGAERQITLTPDSDTLAKVIRRIDVTENAAGRPEHLVIREVSGGRIDIRLTPLHDDN